MTDKELIKKEIERRIENLKISLDKNCVTEESKLDIRGNITTLSGLLNFIDSLQEESASEDLEEYYKKEFLPKEWFAKPGQRTISEFNFFTAKHFAEWQKQKDQETIELAEDHAMLAGMNKMKEEMMKDAVGAIFIQDYAYKTPVLYGDLKYKMNIFSGQPIKLCQIKEVQQ